MTQEATPPRRFGFGTALVSGLLALILVVGGVLVWGIVRFAGAIPTPSDIAAVVEPQPYEQVGPTVVRSIRDLSNLTTVEVVEYTIVEKGTDEGWLAWARGDSLQLFAVARIGAGIDLEQVSVESFQTSPDGVVELTVVPAEIQYVEVDSEATQILDRDTGLFTRGDPRLETDARRLAEGVLVDHALEAGLLERAEDNAQSVISDFLLSLGYRDVVIEFE